MARGFTKKRLMETARRELSVGSPYEGRPTIMLADEEQRYLKFKKAEARSSCPLCGSVCNASTTSMLSHYKDWKILRECVKCGVVEETEHGVRKLEQRTIKEVEALIFQTAAKFLRRG